MRITMPCVLFSGVWIAASTPWLFSCLYAYAQCTWGRIRSLDTARCSRGGSVAVNFTAPALGGPQQHRHPPDRPRPAIGCSSLTDARLMSNQRHPGRVRDISMTPRTGVSAACMYRVEHVFVRRFLTAALPRRRGSGGVAAGRGRRLQDGGAYDTLAEI